jgi:hypothetical protein
MHKEEALRFLVTLAEVDVYKLVAGRPGDLPNLLFDLGRWLDLEEDEPLRAELARVGDDPSILQKIIDEVRGLLSAVADGKEHRIEYQAGSVVLHGSRLA